jgi:transcriptional regulator with XRE-family HTH domain
MPKARLNEDRRATDYVRRVATQLRETRKARGMTLAQLSDVSGVSRAALSGLETVKGNPTLGVLWRISTGLEVPLFQLLGVATPTANLLRGAEADVLRSTDGRREHRRATPAGFTRQVEMSDIRLAGRSTYQSSGGETGSQQPVVLLSGQLRVRVGTDTCDLGTGDSLSFAADRPHRYENTAAEEARYFALTVHPG